MGALLEGSCAAVYDLAAAAVAAYLRCRPGDSERGLGRARRGTMKRYGHEKQLKTCSQAILKLLEFRIFHRAKGTRAGGARRGRAVWGPGGALGAAKL